MTGWIDVKERLPETNKEVLCLYDSGSMNVLYLADDWYSSDTVNFSKASFVPRNKITHWMPLPEPPK